MHPISASLHADKDRPGQESLEPRVNAPGPAREDVLNLFQHYSETPDKKSVAVQLWDGTQWATSPARPPRFKIHVHDPSVLGQLLHASNDLELGDAPAVDARRLVRTAQALLMPG